MNEYIKIVSSAVLNYVKVPALIILAVFVVFVAATVILAVYEIKNDT